MWSDTLLALERDHLLRLLAWSAASIVAGTMVLALLARRARESPLLRHFAIQQSAWGVVELAIGAWAWQGLRARDLAGYVRFERALWLNVGLDAGYVAVGATLAITGWVLGRRLGLVGAGVGVMVQGLALLLLHLVLAAQLAPLVR